MLPACCGLPPSDASLLLGIRFYPREPMSWVGLRNPDGDGVAPSTTYVSGSRVPLALQPQHVTGCLSMARCSLCRSHGFAPEPMRLYWDSSTGVRREIYMESFPFTGTSNTTRSAKCQAEGLLSLSCSEPQPSWQPFHVTKYMDHSSVLECGICCLRRLK